MIRLGLCCAFRNEPIRFETTTAAAMLRRTRPARLEHLGRIAQRNAAALLRSIEYCAAHGIGCFRINSGILPLRTHPTAGYDPLELPHADEIMEAYRACGRAATIAGVRLTFHPDQFVLLNSPRTSVVDSSIAELEHHAQLAEWVGADAITIHGGGAYGDKAAALERLRENVARLSPAVRTRLVLENDDRIFAPADLLPLCEALNLPLVYDVHHHRCLPDGTSEQVATRRALATWDREPLFHLSSPAGGWRADNPRIHADFVRVLDFPAAWRGERITVEVEARAKEAAVLRLKRALTEPRIRTAMPSRRTGAASR